MNSYFTYLAKCITKYFTVFSAIANRIILFTYFSDNSLLVYKNTSDCRLILYFATL